MDLNKAIRDLHAELDKLNEVISAMEEFERTGTLPSPRRRGRKSMDEKERKLVSERMKKYWDSRRKKKPHLEPRASATGIE
jgi:hypothetical protein